MQKVVRVKNKGITQNKKVSWMIRILKKQKINRQRWSYTEGSLVWNLKK